MRRVLANASVTAPRVWRTPVRACAANTRTLLPAVGARSLRGMSVRSPQLSSSLLSGGAVLGQYRFAATVATAGTFDTEVLQSMSALCVVFHTHSRACKAHIAELEATADRVNAASNYTWLKVVTVDSDRNSNLASAFSVERRKVPMTFFVCSGTIIDKVSGKDLPSERLQKIITRFRDYFQKTRGVELEDHGAFSGAKSEKLTEGATTDSLETRILEQLVGATQADARTAEGRAALQTDVLPLLTKARAQALKELEEVRTTVGVDVKRLDELQLTKLYYSSTQYVAAAHLAALEALLAARIATGVQHAIEHGENTPPAWPTTIDAAVRRAEAQLDELKQKFPRATAHPTIRRIAATVDLAVSRIYASQQRDALAPAVTALAAAPTPESAVPPVKAVYDAARHIIVAVDAVDTRAPQPGLPTDRVELLLNDVKALMGAVRTVRKAAEEAAAATVPNAGGAATGDGIDQPALQAAIKLTKRALVAALAMYSDDPHADKLRARATSLLY
jgi:hypothetical protein